MPDLFSGSELTCLRSDRLVFAGLGFDVPVGGALVLRGPNGSGKSSLLRLMAGLLQPALGTILWNGRPVAEDREAFRARLHYVGHQDAVKATLTVRETVAFWARLRPAGGEPARIDQALERLGLDKHRDLPGRFLSAGERRRLALARLVASPAPLWLLDEPVTNLDVGGVETLEGLIADHREGGGIAVLSTHANLDLGGDETVLDVSRFKASGDVFDLLEDDDDTDLAV